MDRIICIAPIMNEKLLINSWYENVKEISDWIIPIVDPRSTDKTIEILENIKDPKLKIVYQNIKLGDSTRDIKGKKKEITYLHNINKIIKWQTEDVWILFLAADERLATEDKEIILDAINLAERRDYDSIQFQIYDMWNKNTRIGWENLVKMNHRKIFRNTAVFGTTAHSGCSGLNNTLETKIPFYQ